MLMVISPVHPKSSLELVRCLCIVRCYELVPSWGWAISSIPVYLGNQEADITTLGGGS